MNFLFACGGTAGHINPALAVAGRLREMYPESKFMFIATDRRLDGELIEREEFQVRQLKMSGIRRSVSPSAVKHNTTALHDLIAAKGEVRRIIREFRPDIAIGTGGYICYPVLTEADKSGVPTVIHESNAVPGLTTSMLQGTVKKIMVAFDGAQGEYKNPDKVIATGTPVREGFLHTKREQAKTDLGLPHDKPIVVSFWGSLGASDMNDMMPEFIRLNCENKSFYHIHSAGEKEYERVRKKLDEMNIPADTEHGTDFRPYIFDMPAVMCAADLIICRAGASTISEITALGRAAVLVPSPNVTNHHQEKNAAMLEGVGGARVLPEGECSGKMLYEVTEQLVNSPAELAKMEAASKAVGYTDAADRIVSVILSLAGGESRPV